MTQTYSQQLKQLNEDWKEFIEQEKLLMVSDIKPEIYEFLFNLTFIRPNVELKKETFKIGNNFVDLDFTDVTFETKYTGDVILNQKRTFSFGNYESYYAGGTRYSFLIDAIRSTPCDLHGSYFSDYLMVFEVEETINDDIYEVLERFDFLKKLHALHCVLKEEQNIARNKLIIEIYNGSTVTAIEENGQSYIVLHDNTKIPFPTDISVKI